MAMVWEPARQARAMAWEKVFGWGLAEGGAVRAAWASAALPALLRRPTCQRERSRQLLYLIAWTYEWSTFSLMLLPRSWKLSFTFGG